MLINDSLDTHVRRILVALPVVLAGGCLAALVMAVISASLPRVYSSAAVIELGTVGENRWVDIDALNVILNGGHWRNAVADLPQGSVRKIWIAYSRPANTSSLRVDAVTPEQAQEGARAVANLAMRLYAQLPPFREDQKQVPLVERSEADALRDQLRRTADGFRARAAELQKGLERAEQQRTVALRQLRDLLPRMHSAAEARAESAPDVLRVSADELNRLLLQVEQAHAAERSIRPQLGEAEWVAKWLENLAAGPFSWGSIQVLRQLAPHLDQRHAGQILAAMTRVHAALAADAAKSATEVQPVVLAVEPALPESPSWPNTPLNVLVAFIFGAMATALVMRLRRLAPGPAVAAAPLESPGVGARG